MHNGGPRAAGQVGKNKDLPRRCGTQLADNNVVIKEGNQATRVQVFSPAIPRWPSLPYRADIIAAMDPLRAYNILQPMPQAQQAQIRRDMPSTARQAINDAGMPFGVLVV